MRAALFHAADATSRMCYSFAMSTSFPTVFMLRAVPVLAAGILSFVSAIPLL
jgi:hypothetical protein